MLDKLRVHYKFKFLIKIKNSRTGWEISKVAPVFTQLGLEEGQNIDDLIKEFFSIYFASTNLTWQFSEFYIVLDLIIWRSTNMSNTIYLKPWISRTLILAYLSAVDRLSFSPFYLDTDQRLLLRRRSRQRKQSKMYAFSIYFGLNLLWTPEWGQRIKFNKFRLTSHTLHSTFLTYLKYFQMLGRKINFRRKVLKKKFEDYT